MKYKGNKLLLGGKEVGSIIVNSFDSGILVLITYVLIITSTKNNEKIVETFISNRTKIK